MENEVTHLYLLVESGGSYSDAWSNNICFYDSLEKAENIATQANELTKIYGEKNSALYTERGHQSISTATQDPEWRTKAEAFLLLTKEVESEYYEKVEKIIGASVEGVWYRWDSTFHVEQIPYL